MTQRLLPNARNMSEFVSGRHGTCGELATLAALACVRPDKWALSPAALERIAVWEIGHAGASDPSGAETPAALTAFLDEEGVRYSRHDPAELRDLLIAHAGRNPVIVEYAAGGHLPGDEPPVRFHYNACLGGDPDVEAYTFADGDNWSVRSTHGLGPLDRYTWAMLADARPVAVILIEERGMITLDDPDVAAYFEAHADGWRCKPTGALLRGGMLAYYRSMPSDSALAGLYELGLPITDEIPVPGVTLAAGEAVPVVQRFELGSRLYDPNNRVDGRPGAYHASIYPAHVNSGIGRS